MNSNTEKLIGTFNQDELKSLVSAMAGYINALRKYHRSTGVESEVLTKLIDAYTVSNYMNAVEIKADSNAPIGSAAYKAYEAMYESDVRAHS
jgi:hypothetical protein